MKKYINYLFVIVVTLFLFKYNCFASTNTYVRTNDNMRLPSDVEVNNDNYNDIIKTPSVSSSEKIYDFAEVISPKDEELLFENLTAYTKNTKYDAIIVTTNDLSGFDIADYAFNFYDYNDFKDEGVVFVIYTGEPEVTIYMANSGPKTSELFQLYNDKIIQKTLEYLYKNYITKNDYFETCNKFVIIINELYERKASKGNFEVDEHGNIVKSIPILEILIIAVASTFIIMVILITSTKHKKKNSAEDIKEKLDKNTMVIRVDYDRLIDSNVK